MITPILITTFKHTGVLKDGTFKDEPGAVNINAGNSISAPKGGCGMDGCNCSPGHWLVIGNGLSAKGVISGKTLYFVSRKDLLMYIKENKIKLRR